MLIQLKSIRNIFRDFGWDTHLPDQCNILDYCFGHELYDEKYRDSYKNMSVFYHKQTDSCYLICERYFHELYDSNIEDMVNQIENFFKIRHTIFNKKAIPAIPKLKLAFENPKDLFDLIEKLSRTHFVEILYMSNLLNYA